jgi:hypothetical protein
LHKISTDNHTGNGVSNVNERRYERYAIDTTEGKKSRVVVIIEGTPVHVVNYSLGGLYVFSDKFFPEGEMVNLSIELEHKGEMKLTGRVVRASSVMNGERWGIAFDLTRTYSTKQNPERRRHPRQSPKTNLPRTAKLGTG